MWWKVILVCHKCGDMQQVMNDTRRPFLNCSCANPFPKPTVFQYDIHVAMSYGIDLPERIYGDFKRNCERVEIQNGRYPTIQSLPSG